MAAVPGSGTIGSANLVSVFGGAAPQLSSQYYRGGARVPATRTTSGFWTYGDWEGYFYQPLGGGQYRVEFFDDGFDGNQRWYWGSSVPFHVGLGTSLLTGGYLYERGPAQGGGDYSIRRRTAVFTSGTTTNINTGVPTSGQISSNQWYGAETA